MELTGSYGVGDLKNIVRIRRWSTLRPGILDMDQPSHAASTKLCSSGVTCDFRTFRLLSIDKVCLWHLGTSWNTWEQRDWNLVEPLECQLVLQLLNYREPKDPTNRKEAKLCIETDTPFWTSMCLRGEQKRTVAATLRSPKQTIWDHGIEMH